MKNLLREKLNKSDLSIGSWIQFNYEDTAEIMSQAGFEWLGIDMEHSAIGIESVLSLIRVVELCGCVPLVRLSENDPTLAKRVMDAGAHGVIVPNVNSPEEAERAVSGVRYPPDGRRGMGLGRAHGYNARFREYLQEVEDYSIIIIMIEHRDAVNRIEEILAVPGIDGLFIGPYDLSASYGVPGEFDHPTMKEAMTKILSTAKETNVSPGIHIVHPPLSQVGERIAEGFTFIAYGGDMLFFSEHAREAAREMQRFEKC